MKKYWWNKPITVKKICGEICMGEKTLETKYGIKDSITPMESLDIRNISGDRWQYAFWGLNNDLWEKTFLNTFGIRTSQLYAAFYFTGVEMGMIDE